MIGKRGTGDGQISATRELDAGSIIDELATGDRHVARGTAQDTRGIARQTAVRYGQSTGAFTANRADRAGDDRGRNGDRSA